MHDMYSHIPSHLPNYIIIYPCKCISKYWLPESLTAAQLKPQLDPHKNSRQNVQNWKHGSRRSRQYHHMGSSYRNQTRQHNWHQNRKNATIFDQEHQNNDGNNEQPRDPPHLCRATQTPIKRERSSVVKVNTKLEVRLKDKVISTEELENDHSIIDKKTESTKQHTRVNK